MVIGGIPSNTSFKSKGVGGPGGHDQDDEEQESFFMHPKNDNQFGDHLQNNHQMGNSRIFQEGGNNSDKNGGDSEDPSHAHNKSKNEMMKLIFMNGPKVAHKNTIKDAILKKIGKEMDKKKSNSLRVRAEKFLGGWIFQGSMTIITIYSLFGDDVRQIAFTAQSDWVFYVLSTISLAAFAIEIILQSLLREDYWLGFYFWLDVISTVSLLTDIGWVMNAIVDISSGGGGDGGSNI
jgi:hypothetical protein